jgi:serine/threonine protein kinase/Tfp pilus assembly protein PilF
MAFTPGETVGSYRIIEKLGHGGMATVYKAYHAPLDRDVAIKVLHPAFKNDPQFFARFQREARIVAKLEHSNIVPVYDFSEHEGEPYLVMRYVQGDTLKPHLQNGPLLPAETLRIMRPVCSALAYAHDQGVLHRDIKPSNIMLTPDGGVYLTDFGLARMVQAGESTLSQDMMVGTPQYISPEQAQGERDLDGRTDIYSLGVVLFEMLTGSVPFSGDTPFAVVHDHIYKPLPLPSAVNPNIAPQVEKVILRALVKDKNERFEKVQDLWQALEEALAPQVAQSPTLAKVVEEKPTLPPAKKSNKKTFIIVGAAVAALLCACLFAIILLSGGDDEEDEEILASAPMPSEMSHQSPTHNSDQPLLPPEDSPQKEPPPAEAPLSQEEEEAFAEADLLHSDGRQMLAEGDLMGALPLFLQAIDTNRRYIPAYIAAAETFLAMDQPFEAADTLQAGIESNPQNIRLRLTLSHLQIINERFPEARATLEEILEMHPDNALAHVGLARIDVAEGNLESAADYLDQASLINPDMPEIDVVEAQILWHQGERKAAIQMLHEAVRNPKLNESVRDEIRRTLEEYGEEFP